MSYITFDYACPACGEHEERFVRRGEMDTQTCKCLTVPESTRMVRLPPGTRTTFRFADTKLKD